MGLFDFLEPTRREGNSLGDLIEHNARRIVEAEGKEKKEATHLAICLVLDDLRTRPNGQAGHQAVMNLLLMGPYQEHMKDVMTYVGWSTGKLKFKPEFEVELAKRHQL